MKPSFHALCIVCLLLCIGCLVGLWFLGTPSPASVTSDAPSDASAAESTPQTPLFSGDAMRAVWVPYFDLDMSGQAVHFGTFKQTVDNILHAAQENGLNTVIVAVHPFCDTFYRSAYFPWSKLLTGIRGKDPGFDALSYWVSATHARGMAFHAWINPLRIGSSPETPSGIPFDAHPDWVAVCDTGTTLNPGIPEVRDYLCDWIREMVSQYEVDAVHIDDYFYPTRDEAYDQTAYAVYRANGGTLSLDDWRTDNINQLVKGLYQAVKESRPRALFGISPAGNLENCLQMYADVRAWASTEGYMDYLCPQLYYNDENEVCPFEETAALWRDCTTCDGVTLYAGLALYKAGDETVDNGTWVTSDSILQEQLQTLSTLGYEGFSLYAYDQLSATETAAEMANVRACIGAVSVAEADEP